MSEVKKESLNKVSYAVRGAQLITYGGIGAMVDFPDQTLMTAAPETWETPDKIHDERFEKALGVDFFGKPERASYVRFPEWYFCPKCRRFQPLIQWKNEFRAVKKNQYENDTDMVRHVKCPKCNLHLIPSSIVSVCEEGHVDDFPWIDWVHSNSKYHQERCNNPRLLFKVGNSATQGLEGMLIQCENCGAQASMRGAFNPDVFSRLEKETEYKYDFKCKGRHPWKHSKEKCKCYPRAMQRGATSAYFPTVKSSLVIPPYSSKLTIKIEETTDYNDFIVSINTIKRIISNEKEQVEIIQKEISDRANQIALKIGESSEQIKKTLERKVFDKSEILNDEQYKIEEYEALNGEFSIESNDDGDFKREEISIDEYHIPGIKRISLIHKIREVQALVGFSRVKPVAGMTDRGFVPIKETDTNWYPAREVRGEGIFIQFDANKIYEWMDGNTELNKRLEILENNNKNSWASVEKKITNKFLLLHTMSHLLIKQLSFECGYNIASLKERLYCMDEIDGKNMMGVLIYTADGDSEGSLGGLVRQGRPDVFPKIFRKAVESAVSCSNDPVCNLSLGQGRDSLNLAACYSCALIPETSCESFNSFLDRGTVIGTFENPEIGFYSDYVSGKKEWNK